MFYPYLHLQLEDLLEEEWRNVQDFEGIYMVSNLGRVKSLDRFVNHKSGKPLWIKGVVLTQTMYRFKNKLTNDYRIALRVALSRENERYDFQVKRLVYQAFIGALDSKKDVVNLDGNGFNNHFNNLEMLDVAAKIERYKNSFRIINLNLVDASTKESIQEIILEIDKLLAFYSSSEIKNIEVQLLLHKAILSNTLGKYSCYCQRRQGKVFKEKWQVEIRFANSPIERYPLIILLYPISECLYWKASTKKPTAFKISFSL